jgi:hypothetical protein
MDVMVTIMIIAPKTVGDRSGLPCRWRLIPREAKISPTSPRGTIPTPTTNRLEPLSAIKPEISFPRIAAIEMKKTRAEKYGGLRKRKYRLSFRS